MEITEQIKAVIVVSSALGIGQAANRAAVLATGLAAHIPNMIGKNPITKDSIELLSFTQVPIPVLSLKENNSFFDLLNKSKELGTQAIVFLARAQGMRSYEEYCQSIAKTEYAQLDIDAVAIYGDPKSVTRITGNLPMLR